MAKRRNTKTKEMVMRVLKEASVALSHDDIEQSLDGQMDRVTIYRILQSFEDDGIVHRIAVDGGKSHFALCHHCNEGYHHDDHIHFRCIRCNSIRCLEESIAKPSLPQGYIVMDITYLISGYCPGCQ